MSAKWIAKAPKLAAAVAAVRRAGFSLAAIIAFGTVAYAASGYWLPVPNPSSQATIVVPSCPNPTADGSYVPCSGAAPGPPTQPYLYTDLGNCQLSAFSAATALSACAGGIPTGATFAAISVETNSIRWRGDNVAPTSTVGNLQQTGNFQVGTLAVGGLAKFKAIPTTGTATLDVEFYK